MGPWRQGTATRTCSGVTLATEAASALLNHNNATKSKLMRPAVPRIIFSASVLCIVALASLAADNPYVQIAGIYKGEVYNGADLDPVTTTFTIERSGRLIGEYLVEEENGAYSGRLSNIVFEDANTITLEWTDQFGEGFAVMEFAEDFRSFAGEWSSRESATALPWNGRK
jgi:hypothetical protein